MKNFNYGRNMKLLNLLQKIKIKIELWFKNWLYRLGIKKTKIKTNEDILGKSYLIARERIPSVTANEANQAIKKTLTFLQKK